MELNLIWLNATVFSLTWEIRFDGDELMSLKGLSYASGCRFALVRSVLRRDGLSDV